MIIQDQINGVLVNDNDQDLSKAIIHLLNDFNRLQSINHNLRKNIEGYDFVTIAQKHILPLYSRFLAQPKQFI